MFEKLFGKPKKPHPKRDSMRELAETVVFVVILVLMLKLFVVEAFVIPTGSMAETLYGYHKETQCEQCGFQFDVNASCEMEASQGRSRSPVAGYCCPNCRFTGTYPVQRFGSGSNSFYLTEQNRPTTWFERRMIDLFGNNNTGGDRVLVHKVMGPEDRGSIVVFKYPVSPQENQTAQNYIKRCIAFGGETVAIHRGELFFTRKLKYPASEYPHPSNPKDLWMREYSQFGPTPPATDLFEANKKAGFPEGDGFQLFRKPDELVMAMRRVVYNNDFQPKDLPGLGVPARWTTLDDGWQANSDPYPKTFKHTGAAAGTLRYQHIWLRTKAEIAEPNAIFKRDPYDLGAIPPKTVFQRDTDTAGFAPKRITNFMGYNAGATGLSFGNPFIVPQAEEDKPLWKPSDDNDHWVGDLMVECTAKIESPETTVILDLARGPNRYQAEFANGQVKLLRTGPGGKLLSTRPTPLTKAGTYDLRFANIDCRLRVWVNGQRIDFGTEADYPYETPTEPDASDTDYKEGYFKKNDIDEPVSIRVQGDAELSKLVIWRDTFYTGVRAGITQTDFLYVPEGHYLCFGDNSSQSSDGRTWGTVPERLMLGRAVFTFFPFHRFGFIR
jgi:signal peptidase I